MQDYHQVVKKSVNSDTDTTTIGAGTGFSGSPSNMLYNPRETFVDINFNLYVADCYNSRIQFFRPGQLNGTIVNVTDLTLSFYRPSEVVLDADGYLYIVDSFNDHIVGERTHGFRCLTISVQ
jgi:hypothetical protein